ncbi:MAG: TatD family hydrolase [Maricaulis sp.]|uniref:TatD family hydrolase n=1 Tax=Maricaulis sp. TaxID=1486257 RepID=UPI001B12C758|nr:TatD family hydrolase [Maricaulis sp.]MBO6728458.1 TatD family hydrolase [Maricaulis sp.]MBO6846509.1 TatD family hydrolase [Maricaulis sp.]MBO6876740.1 TatD family hydrolase [Maricaulis sp.]
MLVDSHVNLHGEQFADDLDEIIARAREAGVKRMLTICCQLADFPAVSRIAETYDDIWCTVGAHPHHAKDRPDITADELIEMAQHPRVVGIGETGLDLHYGYSPIEQQIQSFRAHVDAARRAGLPLIIHTREADELMGDILEEEMGKGAFRPLMHCYTSGPELARRAAKLGAYFAASGIITFKKADDVRAVFRDIVPDDRVIVETDCPYLAPVPHRGKRCEPSFLPHVAAKLGEIKGWDEAETATRTTEAFFSLFDKVTRP